MGSQIRRDPSQSPVCRDAILNIRIGGGQERDFYVRYVDPMIVVYSHGPTGSPRTMSTELWRIMTRHSPFVLVEETLADPLVIKCKEALDRLSEADQADAIRKARIYAFPPVTGEEAHRLMLVLGLDVETGDEFQPPNGHQVKARLLDMLRGTGLGHLRDFLGISSGNDIPDLRVVITHKDLEQLLK